MRNIHRRFLSLTLAGALIAGMLSGCGASAAGSAPNITGTLRGMTVHTLQGADFPSSGGLGSRELRSEIAEMLTYAKENQLNTLFVDVRPAADALYRSKLFPTSASWLKKQGDFTLFGDLLKSLVSQAAQENIQIFAVIDPFYVGSTGDTLAKNNPAVEHPEWTVTLEEKIYLDPQNAQVRQLVADGALEVAENYGVAGVVYANLTGTPLEETEGYDEALTQLVSLTAQQLSQNAPDKVFGVSLDGSVAFGKGSLAFETVTGWVQEGFLDFVQPIMSARVGDEEESYQNLLALWEDCLSDTGVKLYTVHQLGELSKELAENPDADSFELNYQLYINSFGKVDGTIIDSYGSARADTYNIAANMMTLYESNDILGSDIDLSLPQTFEITRPTQRLTTTYAKYFITGISDPEVPLTLDGEEVERFTKSGLFGVLVDVPYGVNTYTFRQGDETRTVTIVRNQPSGGGATPITAITQGSMFPASAAYANLGEEFTLRCVAPAGAKVTAAVGGQTIALKQAATASAGIPATFTGKLTLESGYTPGEVTKAGPVTYTLTYNGVVTNFTSSGDLYVVGRDAALVMEVSDYIAGVTVDETTENEGNFINTLRAGARDYVVGQTTDHFQLKSGGTIRKAAVELLEGSVSIENSSGALHFSSDDRSETFTVVGASHVLARAQRTETGLEVTLYNTSGQDESLTTNSTLFSSIEKTANDDNSVTYHFTLAEGGYLWGYDLSYRDDNLLIYVRKPPVLSQVYGKPLTGISVVLDPGHGGYDPGALGVAGTSGPMERELNLAVAYAAKQRLEQLGATVTMTLTGKEEDKVVLFERMQIADTIKPDFFISLHHNSVGENADANKAAGTFVYYFDEGSQTLAQNIVNRVSEAVDRVNRGAEWSYYVVTKMTYCPSVLAEIGFIVNPAEYEQALDPLNIYKTACAISSSVVSTVENPTSAQEQDQPK